MIHCVSDIKLFINASCWFRDGIFVTMNISLECVSTFKYLGAEIEKKLRFHEDTQ